MDRLLANNEPSLLGRVPPLFQHRVVERVDGKETDRWEPADDPATLTALLKHYTNALRKAGYW